MSGLRKRLVALETGGEPPKTRWIRLCRYEDETTEDAITAYEAEHGPIGENDSQIIRVIVSKPGSRSINLRQ